MVAQRNNLCAELGIRWTFGEFSGESMLHAIHDLCEPASIDVTHPPHQSPSRLVLQPMHNPFQPDKQLQVRIVVELGTQQQEEVQPDKEVSLLCVLLLNPP